MDFNEIKQRIKLLPTISIIYIDIMVFEKILYSFSSVEIYEIKKYYEFLEQNQQLTPFDLQRYLIVLDYFGDRDIGVVITSLGRYSYSKN